MNFAHGLHEAELLPAAEEPSSKSNVSTTTPDTGVGASSQAKFQGAPPTVLHPTPKCTATSMSSQSVRITPRPPHGHELPGPVPPVQGGSTKNRLVCTPDQMKKFLYGLQPTSTASSSQASSSGPVPCLGLSILHFIICLFSEFNIWKDSE